MKALCRKCVSGVNRCNFSLLKWSVQVPSIQVNPSSSDKNTKTMTSSHNGPGSPNVPLGDGKQALTTYPGAEDPAELDIATLPTKDPVGLFKRWFEQAQYSDGIRLATSMTLATASKDGRPSSRIVGVKGFDKAGFKIATNKYSRKAKDMDENPYASIMFYWEPMNRMVRIDGPVEKLDETTTGDIWRGFPRAAQLTHSASKQDEVLQNKDALVHKRNELSHRYVEPLTIPPNPDWCSYNLIPEWWEFYQVTTDLPDRIVFRRPLANEQVDGQILFQGEEGWVLERLYP